MWVYNCCAWACVCVCVGVWDCALHNQKAKTTVSPQIKRISWRREIEWNSSSSSSGYKKRNKTKDIEIKNSWAPQQKQQQHDWRRLEALYMTICMHRFIYVHHTIYELVCVCVYTLQLSLSLRLRLFVFAQTTDNRLFNHKEQIPPQPPPPTPLQQQQQQQILRNNSDESYADFCL